MLSVMGRLRHKLNDSRGWRDASPASIIDEQKRRFMSLKMYGQCYSFNKLKKISLGSILYVIMLGCYLFCLPESLAASEGVCYSIRSVLDYDKKILHEHTSVLVDSNGFIGDTLAFCIPEMDEPDDGMMLEWDSVLCNGVRIQPGGDKSIMLIPVENISESTNRYSINLFYNITFEPGKGELPFPSGFAYWSMFPRFAPDGTTSYLELPTLLNITSYSIKIPRDMLLLTQTNAIDTVFSEEWVEYVFPAFRTIFPIWIAATSDYLATRDAGDIRLYSYRDPSSGWDSRLLDSLASAVAFYTDLFGQIEYDRINLIIIDLPYGLGGGLISNFILINPDCQTHPILDQLQETECKYFLPHEVAHLWWGGSVNIRDDWLAEALAIRSTDWYSGLKTGSSTGGRGIAHELSYFFYRHRARTTTGAYSEKQKILAFYFVAPKILGMLEMQLGHNEFVKGCRQFYQEYKNRDAGLDDFIEVFSHITNGSTDQFFSCWVDSGFSQNYSIGEIESKKGDSLFSNHLIIKHYGKAESAVPVEVKYENNLADTFIVLASDLTLDWESASKVHSVFVDPDHIILEYSRSDNARPKKLKLYPISYNPIQILMTNMSFLASDEPVYHLMVKPDLPAHTDRNGWIFSASLLAKEDSWFYDLSSGKNVFRLKAGYNDKFDDFVISYRYSTGYKFGKNWSMSLDANANRGFGKEILSCALRFDRWEDLFAISLFKASAGLENRWYYTPDKLGNDIWPACRVLPVFTDISTKGALSGIIARIRVEKGLNVSERSKDYLRTELSVKRNGSFYSASVFLGNTNENAAQDRFDLTLEGGMKSYSPYSHYSDELFASNLLIHHPIFSCLGARYFTNYVNSLDGDHAFEFGIGMFIDIFNINPSVISTGLARLIIDVPAYLNDGLISGDHWSVRSFFIRFAFFPVDNQSESGLEFRIK